MSFCKLLILSAATGIFLYLITHHYPETDFWFKGYVVFVFLYLVIFIMFASTYRCFKIGTLRLREILFAYGITVFLTDFIMYFVLSLSAKMLLPLRHMLIYMVVQWITGGCLYLASDQLYYLLYPTREAIVICSEDMHEVTTAQKISVLKERHHISEICSEADGLEKIMEKIERYSTVFIGNIDRSIRIELTDYCFETGKRLLMMPTVEDIIFHNAYETFLGDSLVYLCRNRAFTPEQELLKRLMDIAGSLIGIVLTSPILFFSAMIIKLQDGGPIFFLQTRYTKNMKPFKMIKFRSMVVDAEKDGAQFTVDGDKRITPFGRFMRRYRIDELPQFFNILMGDMSLVGPRAERIENVEYYMTLLPEFRYRMKVKAGLTGYAQIYGKYNTSYEDKLKMDMLYIENCSILRDWQLLFLTLNVLFTPESTEGFAVEKLSELDAGPVKVPESLSDPERNDH